MKLQLPLYNVQAQYMGNSDYTRGPLCVPVYWDAYFFFACQSSADAITLGEMLPILETQEVSRDIKFR